MNTPQIIEMHNQRLLTTEQLAEFYGASLKNIRDNFQNNKDRFIEGKHYIRLEGAELRAFKNDTENIGIVGNRVNQLILYTKQGASRHSKIINTDRAWDMFDELEENYFNPPQQVSVPTNFAEALRLAADLEEEKLALQQQIAEYEPKISYLDTILSSGDTVTTSQIAADYGMSAQALNKMLHKLGVQHKVGGQWLPYRKHMNKKYTKSHTSEIHKADGTVKVVMNTKWTQKGRLFIYELLKAEGYYPQMDLDQIA